MTFDTLTGDEAGFYERDGYKCMTPPDGLRILSPPPPTLPPEKPEGTNQVDWKQYFPWVVQRVHTWTITQMAASLGRSEKGLGEAIQKWQKQGKLPKVCRPTQKGKWTAEKTEQAAVMFRDGFTLTEIGKRLDVHSSTVSYHLHRASVDIAPSRFKTVWRPEYVDIVLDEMAKGRGWNRRAAQRLHMAECTISRHMNGTVRRKT